MPSVNVDLPYHQYRIHIEPGAITGLSKEVRAPKAYIITDEHVGPLHAQAVQAALPHVNTHVLTMKVGDVHKNFQTLQMLLEEILERGIDRNTPLIALGGGVVGDMTGLVASLLMRGVPYIQVPTTLLSQVDSSVGGKTAINTPFGKNLVGTFYQPSAVIIDTNLLKTLPRRQVLAGYAEVVKYGLINDVLFFNWLEENGQAVCALEEEAITHAIATSCAAKAAIVQADEKEKGQRALLNLGHTFGHAIEAATGYSDKVLHGEAVAVGCVMAFALSARMGFCATADVDRVIAHFKNIGLATTLNALDAEQDWSVDALLDFMMLDKKTTAGKKTFILAKGMGEAFVCRDVADVDVREVLERF